MNREVGWEVSKPRKGREGSATGEELRGIRSIKRDISPGIEEEEERWRQGIRNTY